MDLVRLYREVVAACPDAGVGGRVLHDVRGIGYSFHYVFVNEVYSPDEFPDAVPLLVAHWIEVSSRLARREGGEVRVYVDALEPVRVNPRDGVDVSSCCAFSSDVKCWAPTLVEALGAYIVDRSRRSER